MKINFKKGFVIPFIIAVVAILTLGGVVLVTKNKKVEAPVNNQVASSTVATTTDETKEWKIYTNTQYGFELKYPVDWMVTSNFPLLIISPEKYKMLENFYSGKLSQPVNTFNIKISLNAGCFESSGSKEEAVFNGIPAEQFTQEDEVGAVRFICINYFNNTYRIERLTGDTEKKILSTFKFTSASTVNSIKQSSVTVLSPSTLDNALIFMNRLKSDLKFNQEVIKTTRNLYFAYGINCSGNENLNGYLVKGINPDIESYGFVMYGYGDATFSGSQQMRKDSVVCQIVSTYVPESGDSKICFTDQNSDEPNFLICPQRTELFCADLNQISKDKFKDNCEFRE